MPTADAAELARNARGSERRARGGHAPANVAAIDRIARNPLRRHPARRLKAGWDEQSLISRFS